jgi:large subunit ribosomal protein L22
MESRATARYVRVTPRKVNQLLDLVRGKDVSEALVHLTFSKRHIAKKLEKTVRSAVANAIQEDSAIDVDDLYVKEALVGPAPIMKRWLPRAQGRATRFWKRSSHITIILEDKASRKGAKRRKTQAPGHPDKDTASKSASKSAAPSRRGPGKTTKKATTGQAKTGKAKTAKAKTAKGAA